jgi:hypothetical protein
MRWHVNFGLAMAALLTVAVPVPAQVTVGENTSLNLTGNLDFGYSGSYGDSSGSGHGINIGGQGQLTGSYYNPNFLSFRFLPYYNRSQNNSTSQSISDSSGFTGEADFFRGSHFPGAISFSKTFDASGQFGVPGLSGFTSHGGGRSAGITWSALVPNFPTLTASYSSSSDHSEVFGASGESQSQSRILNLQSLYSIDGFRFNTVYTRQSLDANFPELLIASQSPTATSYGSNSINFQVNHKLPLNGQWDATLGHTSFSGDTHSGDQTNNNDGSNNLFGTGVVLNPVSKLSLSFNTNYNTNVYATLQQQILQAGGGIYEQNREFSASALSLNSFAFYTLTRHISLTGNWGHQTQYFGGETKSVSRYGGSANFNYSQKFLGSFTFSVGLVDLANQTGNQGTSLIGNVNFSRRIHGWEVGSGFNYSQFVQTLVGTYTTSNYDYNGSFRRHFRSGLYWSGSFLEHHSGFTQFAGAGNHSESYNTSFIVGRYNLNGNYSQSGGTTILTPTGLVSPPGVPPNLGNQYQFAGKSFGVGAGATIKRAYWTMSYSKSNGDVISGTNPSSFASTALNMRLQYRLRKLYFNSGFTHFQQSFGATGTQPINFNTYFVGITRWFNVF